MISGLSASGPRSSSVRHRRGLLVWSAMVLLLSACATNEPAKDGEPSKGSGGAPTLASTTSSASASAYDKAPAPGPTESGWLLSQASLPVLRTKPQIAGEKPEWQARVDDSTPASLLLASASIDTGARRTYLVDRATGHIRWARDDVRGCFFESDDQVWCVPRLDAASTTTESGRIVVDGSNRVQKQLKGGPPTAAASAIARNRGDIGDGPRTIATVTVIVPARTGVRPFHRIEIRSRLDNHLIVDERPKVESTSLQASVQTFRTGFATSISAPEAPATRLYDNDGRLLTTVPGIIGFSADVNFGGLPIMRVGETEVLINPTTGKILYRKRAHFDYDNWGPDFLTDGSLFVEADGRTKDLGITAKSRDFTADRIVVAGRSKVVVIKDRIVRTMRRSDLKLLSERRLPPGTNVTKVDYRSVIIANENGVEFIQG